METDRETVVKETADKESSEQNTRECRENSIRRDYGFASDVELKECRYCRVMIPKKAKVCPNCRMSLKRHWFRNLVAAVFAIAVIGVGGYYLSEHWGIMRDAVMSVWMAQDGTAVPAVSVTTVGTAEMAAGAATAETSKVTANKEADGKAVSEGETSPSSETASDGADREAERTGDSRKTSSEEEKNAQTDGADGKQSDLDNVSTAKKANAESETDESVDAAIDDEDVEGNPGNGETKEVSSGTTSEKKNTDIDADTQAEEKQETGNKNGNTVNQRDDERARTQETEEAEDDSVQDKITLAEAEDDSVQNKITSAEEEDDSTQDKMTSAEKEEDSRKIAEDTEGASGAAAIREMNQEEKTFRDDCAEVSYKSLLREKETYLDTALKVEVQVVSQVNGGLFDDNVYYLCKTEDINGIERFYIIRDDRETDDTLILEGDTLTVYGRLFGSCRIPSSLIETRPTVPAVSMLYFDLLEE